MSIINLGLQGVALKRSDMSSDSEKVFKNLGTMEEIQNAALYNQTLSEEMKIAIKDTQEILQNRTTRLKLHNQKFKCIDPATHEEINNLFDILKKVDPTVTQNNTSKNKLRTCVDLQEFIKSHCLVREYSFQV
ncbi:hypothetical protein RhiirC2_859338 [Rhizophagus irregularis]|uniref:Uncharacterized protein n=1 Tax=Rhizophagus irregularis TaxID=588596 RepID=A0A2N1KVU9_9GLOM|nr:hypothetical protein RhiirC2_859338 [Rhizophagus irregularis]